MAAPTHPEPACADLAVENEVLLPAGRLPQYPAHIDVGDIASARYLDNDIWAIVETFGDLDIFVRL